MKITTPNTRRLKGYAYDPSLSIQLETVSLNETIFNIRWEKVDEGRDGEYIEAVD